MGAFYRQDLLSMQVSNGLAVNMSEPSVSYFGVQMFQLSLKQCLLFFKKIPSFSPQGYAFGPVPFWGDGYIDYFYIVLIISIIAHSCRSLHRMTTRFYGVPRTNGSLLISSLSSHSYSKALSDQVRLVRLHRAFQEFVEMSHLLICYCFPFLVTLLLFWSLIFLFLIVI